MEKVIRLKDSQGEAYFFYCPGCSMNHIIPVHYEPNFSKRNGKLKPVWKFSGDLRKPTFKPEFVVEWVGAEPPQSCHVIIREGWLIYLVGSTHKLSGQRVKMKQECDYFEE